MGPKLVLTAAHCIEPGGFKYFFGVGEVSQRKTVPVVEAIVHPDYGSDFGFRHDIAVLTLASEVAGVTPAELADVEKDLPSDCAIHEVGYGVSVNTPENSNVPTGERRGVDLCRDLFDGANLSYLVDPKKGIPCWGDSGAGLMIKGTNKLIAIDNSVIPSKPEHAGQGCFPDDTYVAISVASERAFMSCAADPARRAGGAFPDTGCSWADPFARAAKALGVVKGDTDGSFHPGRLLKRSELAAMIVKAFALTPKAGATPFKDVPATHWAAGVINAANAARFLSGYPDGTFHPDDPVKHVEVVVALTSGLGLAAPSTSAQGTLLAKLEDADAVPTWARAKVATAIAHRMLFTEPGIGYFAPDEPSSRGFAVATVYRAMVDKGLATTPVVSPYLVTP